MLLVQTVTEQGNGLIEVPDGAGVIASRFSRQGEVVMSRMVRAALFQRRHPGGFRIVPIAGLSQVIATP